jgi:tRNA threonylcarbamoyladenosine biosynthesis protein TsaE
VIDVDFTEEQLPGLVNKLKRLIRAGDIVAFKGDLAAGKTTLIRQLLRAWGYEGKVSSPTFVIEHRYQLNSSKIKQVIHLDFYRLAPDELGQFDWNEYSQLNDGIVLIEWPERADSYLTKKTKFATLERINDRVRHFRFPADTIN